MSDYEDDGNILINNIKCRLITKIYADIRYRQTVSYDATSGLDGIEQYFNEVALLPDDKMRVLMHEYNQL